MQINTKYNIGDKVWYIWGNKVVLGTIKQVSVNKYADYHKESYIFESWDSRYADQLFTSRDKARQALKATRLHRASQEVENSKYNIKVYKKLLINAKKKVVKYSK